MHVSNLWIFYQLHLMPRMQSSSGHCCLCVVGVFMFLAGVIMIATGVCLILNYGVFDVNLLPPELRSDDGKRTVGIILTTIGFVAILVSVLVSVFFLCFQEKSSVSPNQLSSIPDSERKPSREKHQTDLKKHAPSTMHSNLVPQSARKRHKKGKHARRNLMSQVDKLEGIKETDAISRKQSEKSLVNLNGLNSDGTPRSEESDENRLRSENSETESAFGPSDMISKDESEGSGQSNQNGFLPSVIIDHNPSGSSAYATAENKTVENTSYDNRDFSESSANEYKNKNIDLYSPDNRSINTPETCTEVDFESQVENLIR
ncbi:hypothetical protein KUTeg_003871 [Tegillarca granosa]|uniref:Uncharacterized protein n=1 Tax=Tegillarca granosa TaxID=220873 RepID=A0ABQ9FSU5_TEGGR|nr:hypothetical protein KUTeg_003871 [Tegillarca granosa]